MAKKSIRERLEKLESECKFLDWFVLDRFCTTLTMEELETWASGERASRPRTEPVEQFGYVGPEEPSQALGGTQSNF